MIFPSRATASVVLSGILVGCLIGVFVASWVTSTWGIAVGWLVTALSTLFVMSRAPIDQRVLLVGLVTIGFGFGVWRLSVAGPSAESVAWLVGSERVVEGTVTSRDVGEMSQRLTLDRLVIDGKQVEDHILLTMPTYPRLMPGDRTSLVCELESPKAIEGFAYDRYLAARDIYAICRTYISPTVITSINLSLFDRLGRGREWMIDHIERTFGEPHAALLSGLLLGTSRFSDAWTDRFAITGTSHIVAASGYNVSIVAKLLMAGLIFVGLWRRQAFFMVLVGLVIYAILAGAEAPVIRAAIMGALVLLAEHLGRRTSLRNIFLLVIVGMLMFEPRLLRDDIGFQLSALSTLGLLLFTPLISRQLAFVPNTGGVREALSSTLAATLATLPLIIMSFGQLSLIAPLSNLLVLPFVPYIMAAGAVVLIVSLVSTSVAAIVGLPAWLGLTTVSSIILVLADLPLASLPFEGGRVWLVLAALVISVLSVTWLSRRPASTIESVMPAWATMSGAVVIILFLVIARQVNATSAKPVTVWVFDVGQGDAIYIDGPGRDILIDGGPSNVVIEKLTAVLPPWDRTLDAILLTHGDADHVTGLNDVVRRFDVSTVYTSGALHHGVQANEFLTSVDQTFVAQGGTIDLGHEVKLEVLWPDASVQGMAEKNANDQSVITLLKYGETSVLLTGDAPSSVEASIETSHVDVFKVGHHGSDTSTSQVFLDAVTPDIAVISVGADNDYGHPTPFVIDRLQRVGAEIFRTDQGGDVRIETDGGEPAVNYLQLW